MPRAILAVLLVTLFATVSSTRSYADEKFDSFDPIVEINASDGDVGFHFLVAGGPARVAVILDQRLKRIFRTTASHSLRAQGLSEVFVESAEPKCWTDPEEDPDEEVRTVAQFTDRFREGTYLAMGRTLENELIWAGGTFTHNLPAAPVTNAMIVDTADGTTVQISWEPGTDLGNCEFADANIPDPASVEVVRWEISFEPDIDDLPAGFSLLSKYAVQLPGDARNVTVPAEFLAPWLDAGVSEFKYEIGAKEESGNQTFTEQALEI